MELIPPTYLCQSNSTKIACSICIANFNGEKYISDCIESILCQDFNLPIEIIVHDDASIDNSVNLIRSKYPDIHLIASRNNVGFCISNNRMVEVARGDTVLLLNNDAKLNRNALSVLHGGMEMYGEGIYGLPEYDMETAELLESGYMLDLFLNPVPNLDKKTIDVGYIIGACLFLPISLWNKIGGFPSWFETLAEDLYLCCCARLYGYPVKILTSSGFDHWVGKSLGGGKVLQGRLSTTLTRRAKSERNKTAVMLMCYPLFPAILLVPIHIFLLVIEGLLLTAIKRDRRLWLEVYWFCLREVWEKRNLWIERRRSIQSRRLCVITTFFSVFKLIPHKLRMLLTHGIPEVR